MLSSPYSDGFWSFTKMRAWVHACVALKESMKRNGLLFHDRVINYHSQCCGTSYFMGALQKLRPLTFFNHALSLTALSSERAHPRQLTTTKQSQRPVTLPDWFEHVELAHWGTQLAEDEATQLPGNWTSKSSLSCLSQWLSSLLQFCVSVWIICVVMKARKAERAPKTQDIFITLFELCVCVFMYVYMYVCKFVCVYLCMYVCIYVCVYVCSEHTPSRS